MSASDVEKKDPSVFADDKSVSDKAPAQAGIHDIPVPDPAVQRRILLKFDFIMLPLLALFYLWCVPVGRFTRQLIAALQQRARQGEPGQRKDERVR